MCGVCGRVCVVRRRRDKSAAACVTDAQKCHVGAMIAQGMGDASALPPTAQWLMVADASCRQLTLNRVCRRRHLMERLCWADSSTNIEPSSLSALDTADPIGAPVHVVPVATVVALTSISVTVICSDVRHAAALIGCHDDVTTADVRRLVSRLLCGRGFLVGACCLYKCRQQVLARRFGVCSVRVSASTHNQPSSKRLIVGLVDDSSCVRVQEIITELQVDFFASHFPASGHDTARRRLLSIFERGRSAEATVAGGVLVVGPAGCGKACLVRSTASHCAVLVLELSCAELTQTAASTDTIERLFDEASCYVQTGQRVAILLRGLDELSQSAAAVNQLLNQLSSACVSQQPSSLVVVATACQPHQISPLLRTTNKFPHEIHLNIGSSSQRADFINTLLTGSVNDDRVVGCGRWRIEGASVAQLAELTVGYAAADLRRLLHEAIFSSSSSSSSLLAEAGEQVISMQSVLAAMRCITPTPLKGVAALACSAGGGGGGGLTLQWRHLAGLDAVRARLEQCVVAPLSRQQHRSAAAPGVIEAPVPRGLLLHGPPGCAKTSLVRALAGACRASFLSAAAADVYSPYVGDAERAIRELFTHARMVAPSIIFLDELDALVGARGRSGQGAGGVQTKVLSALLNEMDGVGIREDYKGVDCPVFVVGATNRRDLIDEALLRPGRLDQHIHVPLPDRHARQQIIQLYTGNTPLAADVSVSELASLSAGSSGADLKQLCNQAALNALSECMQTELVSRRHFVAALNNS